ncbi:MAG: S1C family serine protease [Calditrichaceae bacterium]
MKLLRLTVYIAAGVLFGFVLWNSYTSWQDRDLVKTDSTSAISDGSADKSQYLSGEMDRNLYSSRETAVTRAIKKVSPAVVSVNVTKIREYIQRNPFAGDPFFKEFFPEIFRDRKYRDVVKSIGSGFLVSEDGYILTNEHVVENATEIIISMSNGQEHHAKFIGSDRVSDIALLKLDGGPFPYIRMGDSDQIIIGEWAIALGNPFGLFLKREPTVTVGVISATDRDFGRVNSDRIYQDMIQTDASINNGNSGGPLCNALGEVIGMNTFIYTSDQYSSGSVGIGFAIPIKRIKEVFTELKQHQKIDRAYWTGMYYSNLSRFLAAELGYNSTDGAYIPRIDNGSPADKAGLKVGDIVVRINESDIHKFSDIEDATLSMDLKVGDKMNVTVWRENKYMNFTITLEKRKG